MIRSRANNLLALTLASALASMPGVSAADDIDIFTGLSGGTAAKPNVLIVLDNTSNWSRMSQKWPGGRSQGESEARAIKAAIKGLDANIKVGLMEFATGGSAGDNGGFIRYAIAPMDAANKNALTAELTTIEENINNPDEKRNANTPYGNLMYDVYNYFAGANSYSPAGVIANLADSEGGYTTPFTRFKSPITADATCGKMYVVFISNPNSSGPSSDSAENTAALAALNGKAVSQIGLPKFTSTTKPSTQEVGTTASCHASPAAAEAELSSTRFASKCSTYTEGCKIGEATPPSEPVACPTNTRSYSVYQQRDSAAVVVTGTSTNGATGNTNGTYGSASDVPASDTGSMTCPARQERVEGSNTVTTTYHCTYKVLGEASTPTVTNTSSTSTGCYAPSGSPGAWSAASKDYGSLSCPTTSVCTYSGGAAVKGGGSCPGKDTSKVTVTQRASSKVKFRLQQVITPTVTTAPTGASGSTQETLLGMTAQCYSDAPTVTADYPSACTGGGLSCTYRTPTATSTATCPPGTNAYKVMGTDTLYLNEETGTTYPDAGPRNADEWAQMMSKRGIPVPGSTIRPQVTTYTVDVYNAQQNAEHTSLMMSMAQASGGKYFAAKNEQAIIDALKEIIVEIQAVNSAFAATSLPVNATNRSQTENQVFIGMFRPDPKARPRWFGNLKRYQLISSGGVLKLGGVNGQDAVNKESAFFTPCATSWWTNDSNDYWMQGTYNPDPKGTCPTGNPYSDLPDGPLVEKGAVAQVLRQGNNGAKDSSDLSLKRDVKTESGGKLVAFDTTTSGLSETLVKFIRGEDTENERDFNAVDLAARRLLTPTETRPSIHGDVIHSRPLPVNYAPAAATPAASTSAVTVYYGANDGTLRAINAENGVERWAFVAPEFFPRLSRLRSNSPLINYPGLKTEDFTPTPTRKDYFFDGSIGLYQNRDNSKVMIYPTMRRGGRMVYALDVTKPDAPNLAWKIGCPSMTSDAGCTPGYEAIGQTWSIPNVAFIKGFQAGIRTPLILIGGGYDSCEDADNAAPACGATKGNRVFIINALTGHLVKSFETTRAVAGDVSVVDVDADGFSDYAYAADVGGSIYRIDFMKFVDKVPVALASKDWNIRTIAATGAGGRKFLFSPALLGNQTRVYIAIGSGDREHPLSSQYPFKSVVNRFYVYKDDLIRKSDPHDLDTLPDHTTKNSCDAPMALPEADMKGWYIDLSTGEQVVTSALIANGMVTFNTNRPVPPKEGVCSTTLGEAAGYWLNLFNGSGAINVDGTCGGDRRSVYTGGGLPPTPVMASAVGVQIGSNKEYVSVVIGAVQKGKTGNQGGVSVPFSPQVLTPAIRSVRKRSYSYIKSD